MASIAVSTTCSEYKQVARELTVLISSSVTWRLWIIPKFINGILHYNTISPISALQVLVAVDPDHPAWWSGKQSLRRAYALFQQSLKAHPA